LGGKPKDEEIRTMANSLYQKWDGKKHIDGDSYMQLLNPDYLMIENVVEFMSWGPLDENKKPITKLNGKEWLKWSNNIRKLGYTDEWKQLNSADYAAYTSRNRLFGCFAKNGLPIAWPVGSHSKTPLKGDIFQPQQKWKAVKEVLDLEDEGKSIFNRKKELSDKTLDVIAKGLFKALKSEEHVFLFKYYGKTNNFNSVEMPAGVITTKDRFALIFRQYKTGYTSSINEPIGVLPTNPKANLLSFIMNPSHGGHTTSIEKPCPVIIARQDKAPLYIIKCLMEENGIADIKMRMLKVPELKQIQGFPSDYKLAGNQSEQKKFIGNSVVPQVVTAWCLAMASKLHELRIAV
jgi:DNA (cytosine-5)-methyltransferase 1